MKKVLFTLAMIAMLGLGVMSCTTKNSDSIDSTIVDTELVMDSCVMDSMSVDTLVVDSISE